MLQGTRRRRWYAGGTMFKTQKNVRALITIEGNTGEGKKVGGAATTP